MCPDRQILSVFFDDELESPWKEKLESHLEQCASCREGLAEYQHTRQKLNAVSADMEQTMEQSMEQAMERVWQKIDLSVKPKRRFLSGSITIPIPLAAAAGLVMVLAMAALIALRQPATIIVSDPPQLAGMEIQEMIPTSDMAGFFHYLANESANDLVIIRLPETTFMNIGEPRMLRAADFSRDGGY